ncbi:TPA: ABC transporter permease [Streptococcus pneumoniae]|uniref:ABC transporter permease n=1 Tax=Streptococcus pneumoniae TaxID=1313 RepID=UPI000B58A367|nr:ABC transporter permease [Streptococcus pneumoniae]SNH50245.1 ABC transporter permease [Streptococcus pneumoniae]SNM47234.1 ABC transporter permease [Streptococcus pneumoniae]SNO28425.1 ABC transporter permease [Streptococcus pneumoniae]SNP28495.1 ABC transporter permease [Streptococcus pneumoniae]SPR83302.1 ABC transporter permease [Streptococcus pneumoniae]
MKLKLCIIGFFFCLIATIGLVTISDTEIPIPLPIDGAFSIQGKSNLSNNEIYEIVRDLSKTEKVTIYKPIVQSSGQLKYVNFDDVNNEQLKSAPIVGMYYTLGKMDVDSLKPLTMTGLQTVYMAYPWYIGGILQFTGTLRILLMGSIYLTLLVVLFVVRTRQIKEGVIRRSLGLPIYDLRREYGISLIFELIMMALLMISYSSFLGNGFFTYSSKLFFSLLLTNFILFQIIDLITFVLFWLTIQIEKPIEIIKNKAKNKLIFVVWLAIISIIILVSGVFLQETKSSQSSINIQIQNLVPWDTVKDWRRIEFLGIESNSTKNREVNDSDGQYLQIVAALKNLDFLYIERSSAYVPDFMKTSHVIENFSKQLENDGITNPEINKELIYINQTGANLQNKVNGTNYHLLDNKIATIYIPEKWKENQKSIENTVVAEQFIGTNYTREQLAVQIIPDGEKIFYFNEDADNNLKMKDILPLANVADSKDNIVVVLDTDKMMENNKFSLASNILYKSLFSPEAVKKINEMTVLLNFSMNPVDVYQIVKLKIQSLEHQILLSQILQKIIYSIVFILIYQYVQLFITLKQNEYVKKIILGLSKTYIAISSLKYFMMTITMVILFTFLMTGQIELLYIGAASLLVLMLSIIMSFRKLSESYTKILKGDES